MSIRIHNIVKMASAAVASRALGWKRPLNIMLAVTDRCTGGCVYCQIPQRRTPEMSLGEIATLVGEAARLGCQRIGLWGGEPLCREDLGAIIREVRRHRMFVTVDTNGHLLPERGEQVREVDHLNIGLDGDRPAHDGARGPGTFDRTLRGITYAAERHRLWTITVLNRLNLGEVDWILDLARRIGFLTAFQVLHHNETLGRNDGWRPDDRDLREVLRQLVARKKEGAPIALSLGYLERMLEWPDYATSRLPRHPAYPPCLAGKLYCNVDVDGRIYPCSLLIGEAEAPNVREVGLERAFKTMAPPPCQACTATCFTEYNLLFGLDWRTGLNWVRALRTS